MESTTTKTAQSLQVLITSTLLLVVVLLVSYLFNTSFYIFIYPRINSFHSINKLQLLSTFILPPNHNYNIKHFNNSCNVFNLTYI